MNLVQYIKKLNPGDKIFLCPGIDQQDMSWGTPLSKEDIEEFKKNGAVFLFYVHHNLIKAKIVYYIPHVSSVGVTVNRSFVFKNQEVT